MPLSDIPFWLKVAVAVWPLAIGGGAILTAEGAARSEVKASLNGQERRLTTIETQGSPVVRERLARIEQNQINQKETLDDINRKLDDLVAR